MGQESPDELRNLQLPKAALVIPLRSLPRLEAKAEDHRERGAFLPERSHQSSEPCSAVDTQGHRCAVGPDRGQYRREDETVPEPGKVRVSREERALSSARKPALNV